MKLNRRKQKTTSPSTVITVSDLFQKTNTDVSEHKLSVITVRRSWLCCKSNRLVF